MARTEKQTSARLPIGKILLIAFIVMPLIEIAVLIQIGSWLGLWPTLGLIILTAIIGTWMLRQQGFAVLARVQQQLAEGSVPLGEVFEGFCLVIAGALLLTPGFVTDVIGGSLLMRPVRVWLYRTLGGRFRAAAMPNTSPGRHGPVVDGDFETVDPDQKPSSTDGDLKDDRSPGAGSHPMPPPRGRWDGES
ncbi:MAG: FxsA family protein [Geminicoccaceae bacterium]